MSPGPFLGECPAGSLLGLVIPATERTVTMLVYTPSSWENASRLASAGVIGGEGEARGGVGGPGPAARGGALPVAGGGAANQPARPPPPRGDGGGAGGVRLREAGA